MGRLHPADFRVGSLKESEARVVEALLDYTDSNWIVMPTVRIGDRPPVEIDIVVANPVHGVGVIEVKGYLPRIVRGTWIEPYEDPGAGPVAQMIRNRFALRSLLRRECVEEPYLEVESAIAFVNAKGFSGEERPHDIEPEQLIWSDDLETIDHSLLRFMWRGTEGRPMFDDGVFAGIVRAIRPSVDFEADAGAYTRWARDRIETRTGDQTRAVERLDLNRKVYVTGGAGTGKSRLALAWARRAAMRGERTLLVCFSEPLGFEFRRRMADVEDLKVGPFLRVALEMDGIPPLEVPAVADAAALAEFWNTDVQGHLHLHWPDVQEAFDTIVVDEVQDFSPSWLAMLEGLLDPDGPRRLLLTGDSDQQLHRRGFVAPRPDDGWTLCELVSNTRNSREIARLLRSRFAGPPAPSTLPVSTHLTFQPIETTADLTAAVRAEVLRLRGEGFPEGDIAIACLDSSARDAIRESAQFVRWEDRGEGLVVCETARRLKGLEFGAVVLVGSEWPVDDAVLYVGVSRAVMGLSIIGPPELGEHLGVEPSATVET